MARKNFKSFALIDDGDLSGAIVSTTTNVQSVDKASIHVSWAGTSPVGEFTVQARNSESDAWYVVDMGGTIAITGNSGNHQLIFNELPFYEIRLNYAATSGSGSVDAIMTMKQVGG